MMTTEMVLAKVWPDGEYACAYCRVACSGGWAMLDFFVFEAQRKFKI
jgi:hypothetical protein